jgi:cellobiose-specific phosphotransferase system component IIA
MSSLTHSRLITAFMFIGLIVLPLLLFAQEDASSTEATTTRAERQERFDEAKDNVASRTEAVRQNTEEREQVREERRAGLRQAALDRIQNLLDNMVRRMGAAIGRLENIADRLTSRANKIAVRYNADVSATHNLINDAENELATASTLLVELIDETNGTLGEPEPRAQFARVRAQLKEAAHHIRTAHRMLREAVAALKATVGETESADGVSDAVRESVASSTDEIE